MGLLFRAEGGESSRAEADGHSDRRVVIMPRGSR